MGAKQKIDKGMAEKREGRRSPMRRGVKITLRPKRRRR